MTIITDRGNFGSFHDILTDMRIEGYGTITVQDTQHICNQIHLGSMGELSTADIENIIKQGVQ